VGVFLWSGGRSSSAQAPARSEPDSGSLERALSEPRTPLELRRRLGALDAAEIPRLFRLAATGFLPGQEPGSAPALGDAERQIVRESLCARPRREVVSFLADLASRPLETPLRLEAQRALGSMGCADHLKLLARLTLSFQERGPAEPSLRAGFRGALAAILARDPSALSQVPALFADSPPGLGSSIVEALAGSPSPVATSVLAGLLGRSPGIDPLLLARLAKRGRLHGGDEQDVLTSVRRYLRQRDPLLVTAAARACGALGDDGAVETLVELVEHPDLRVRQSVFDALARISGLAYGEESRRWERWYRAEMRWWEDEADSLLARVERGRGLEFVRAAREALGHRLFRNRIAESFAQALRRGSGEEARLACSALEQLRSPVAVPALVECLQRDDALVRQRAWRALRAITGVELPPESDSWADLAG
jgi:hypothetical protein